MSHRASATYPQEDRAKEAGFWLLVLLVVASRIVSFLLLRAEPTYVFVPRSFLGGGFQVQPALFDLVVPVTAILCLGPPSDRPWPRRASFNEAVEMVDYERARARPASRAALLNEITGDSTWQPTFVFYMGYPTVLAHASPCRPVQAVLV